VASKPFDIFEVRRAQALKAWRSAIRLKHSLAADEEIARTLPEVEKAINTALHTGEPLALDVSTAFKENV
jgi:hypothetical protein